MSSVVDLLICLRFFSRLPLPATRHETECGPAVFSDAASMVPVAGAIIGCVPALSLLAATAMGLPPQLEAPIAVATLVAVTGALHEDGLADCADGFGGGRTLSRKLEIMRDSRIGTFGACAIALSLYVRAAALGTIAIDAPWRAAAAVVAAAAFSRATCLLPLILLPPARPDGLGAAVGKPRAGSLATALALAIALSLIVIPFGTSAITLGLAITLALVGALSVCALAWRQIAGQTGDVAGAAQQIAEIIILLVLARAA